jgi:hypothetical protein
VVRVLRAVGGGFARLPRWAGFALVLLWMAGVWRLSSMSKPVPVGVRVPLFLNDLAHAPLFGLGAFAALVALPRRTAPFRWPRLGRRECLAVLTLVLCYAVVDELHQATTPGRDASPGDVLTDLAGGWAVLLVATAVGRPDVRGGEVWRRLGLGALLCLAAAACSTFLIPV